MRVRHRWELNLKRPALLAVMMLVGCRTKDVGAPAAPPHAPEGSQWWQPPAASGKVPTAPRAPLPPVTLPTADAPRLLLTADLRARLVQRARAGDRAWAALKADCDSFIGGKVEWPDGNDYADPPNVGEGYQGSGYFAALVPMALCHRMSADGAPGDAASYGKKGAEILNRMSELEGRHAVSPLRDSGYGIRNFGVGMALGYDWLRDSLSREEKARVVRALDKWITAYEKSGFGNDHPQGNYFAGYYAAKALAALAVEGDDPLGATWWKDWLERVQRKMVGPYYAKYLAGGGWPEGFHYGQLATMNMVLPALAAASAKSMTLEGFRFSEDQAATLIHFSWPNRRTLDDRGAQKVGNSPSAANAWLYVVVAGALEMLRSPFAPTFHSYASEVRSLRSSGPADAWQEMLFWDERAASTDYKKLPLSYATSGMQTVAARSSWATDAVWASFTSGTYVNNPSSGEMSFDQGSLVIVKGGQPFLVNAAPTLKRNTPGTEDGEKSDGVLYEDEFGNNDVNPKLGNRTTYNIFYSRARRFGQFANEESKGAKTRLGLFEDAGPYVVFRGDQLEDMYLGAAGGTRNVVGWTRQVVYLRPGTFVVDDRTAVASAESDQYMAFHFCGKPMPIEGRFDFQCGGSYAGSLTALLPSGAKSAIVDLFELHKVFRVEERPATAGATQRWLNVLDASGGRPGSPRARLLATESDATATHPAGTTLERAGATDVVASAWGSRPGSFILRYSIAAADGLHVITDLAPKTKYRVEVNKTASALQITIRLGDGYAASAGGVLAFRLAGGVVASP